MRHAGITGFEVKTGRDGGISEPGTGPSYWGNLTIIVLSLYYCSTAFLLVLLKYSQVNMIEIQVKNIEYRLTEYW